MTGIPHETLGFESLPGRMVRATVRAAPSGALVSLDTAENEGLEARAVRAVGPLRAGDEVLVSRSADGAWWILAVCSPRETAELVLQDGARASLAGEVLRVQAPGGQVLFEYDAASQRATACVPEGDLALAVSGTLTLRGGQGVKIESDAELSLTSGSTDGARSRVSLDAARTRVESPDVLCTVESATLHAQEARVVARWLETTVETAKHVAGVVELRANRLVERLQNAYREVEKLSQTHAGRVRIVAREEAHLEGREVRAAAEKGLRLEGEKVYVG